ncbi:MAG: PAS domain-containing protein [Chitinivibrionales bacterium]|nr:PAS domain-containing protein [Chitinivibrionales bacterium]
MHDYQGAYAWSQEKLLKLLDTVQEGVFVVDKNNKITFFNHAAETITETSKQHAIGRSCWEVLRADCCGNDCPLRKAFTTGELFSERPVTIVSAKGSQKTISISTTVLHDSHGEITEAIETFRDISFEDTRLRSRFSAYRRYNIITINPALQKIIDTLPMIAESSSTVLLQGESGTGKGLVAAAIHGLSARKNKPFISVNCGALPDNLLESELFGYKAGAFTDAKKDKAGRFALAEGGVLFLDEIGDTSPAMQVKLLRAIQEKVYEPLGSTQSEYADVRIITASNKNLLTMVENGLFRRDLFYRLNVISITLPPLRERREDIPLLLDCFVDRLNKLQKKRVRGVDEEAMACLMAYDYPGNIRELENLIERAFVLCHRGYIEPRHLPQNLCEHTMQPATYTGEKSLKSIEAAFITNALKSNNWDRQKTAKQLGIHRSSLYRKMHQLGIYMPVERHRKTNRRPARTGQAR